MTRGVHFRAVRNRSLFDEGVGPGPRLSRERAPAVDQHPSREPRGGPAMSVPERVRAVIEPVVAAQGLELFDLEQAGPVLRVTVDRPGGVDMEAIASTTRALSRALDEHDPIAGHYTLEVSSPGLERPLRTPAHW